ncbi:MAG: HD domain-containing protein [Bacteroidales bacterium]|jgi:GTP pyrophosphokinase|nr:HD domain-containing protein [Bacteroidales bacterium]
MKTVDFAKILVAAQPFIKQSDIQRIEKAYSEAQLYNTAEEMQKTLETTYIAVTNIGIGDKAMCSLLLFYVFQNQNITKENLNKEFGTTVSTIVEGLARVRTIDTSKSKFHSENFIKLLLSQTDDVRILLLLLAQKLYELRSIKTYKHEAQIRLCEELSTLYAPIAHRLGLYAIKTEMEEMCMKYLHNDAYKMIAQKLAEKKSMRDAYIKTFIAPIEAALKEKGFQFEIKGRPKSIHSIWKKIQKSKVSFEHIYDLFAIRIIIDTNLENEKSACWNVYSIVSDLYRPNPNRLRDWISSPKNTGYESLHTTVLGQENRWVEVQIRTRRMDEIAEKGHAAHWKYKEGAQAVGSVDWLAKIRAILENPDNESMDDESNSRMQLYTDEIFIFTPNNDLRKLRAHATVLDFAYDIHGNIGNTCVGGKVNGKVVPIKHRLENGDRVEILTSKTQTPKRDWLSFVQTSKARSNIKKFLNDAEFKHVEQGKEIVLRKFAQLKLKFNDDLVIKLLKHLSLKNTNDLYLAALNNKIDFSCLKELFIDTQKTDNDKKAIAINPEEFKNNIHKKLAIDSEDLLIIDNNVNNVDYKFAPCCNPIKGDEIFGFVTAGGGIKIHRLHCPNALNMLEKYPYRIIKTQWTSTSNNSTFTAGVLIIGNDDLGIINNVTQLLGREKNIAIRTISINSRDGQFEGYLSLSINDSEHLAKILDKIRSIKGVHSAERVDNFK